jgi:hypothetical protein
MSRADRNKIIVAAAAFIVFLFALRWETIEGQKAILRDQFHLTSSMSFVSFESGSRKLRYPGLQGTVRFSESEYRGYIAAFANANTWKAKPLRYRGVTTIGHYSPDALQWRDTKPPLRFGSDGLADWGIYADSRLNELADALHFCYAVKLSPTSATASAPTYAAVSCWELDSREDPIAVVQGMLDPETRTLYMRI